MLLVLASMWGAFIVWWLRGRTQGTFGDSVGTFSRHLRVLESAAPSTVRPANRLRGAQMVPAYRARAGTVAPSSGARRSSMSPRSRRGVGGLRRRQTLRRRRDVLFVLGVAVAATLAMALATRSRSFVFLQLFADAVLCAYLALLVRLRNVATERDLVVSYLPRSQGGRHGLAGPAEAGSAGAPERRDRVGATAAGTRTSGEAEMAAYGAIGAFAGTPGYAMAGYGSAARSRTSYADLGLRRTGN